jgi:hypothetical protein
MACIMDVCVLTVDGGEDEREDFVVCKMVDIFLSVVSLCC